MICIKVIFLKDGSICEFMGGMGGMGRMEE